MSAYIVNDKTINRIVSMLNTASFSSGGRTYPDTRYFDGVLQVTNSKECAELGKKLREMNERAIIARYDEKAIADFTGGKEYKYEFVYPPRAIQAYKSLRCFLYQCSEGDVPKEPLFKELDRYAAAVAEQFVCNLPEYDQADWG